ncbi:MAG: DUF3048 domain-containing protein [Microgenomates group bacterium]
MLEKSKNKKIIFTILGGIFLYLLSAGISYAGFKYFLNSSENPLILSPIEEKEEKKSGFKVDLSAPKTEVCPLNGALFTKGEKEIWEKRRPLTVMIENHQDSRPQSGLSKADVIYEAVAEGGITRFLAVFYCGAAAEEVIIGPVRSARTYFMDFASEYGDYPLYAHVGGANKPGPADALGQIEQYGWLKKGNDLNQFALGYPVYWRDYERIGHPVATEHTVYSSTEKLWEVASKRGLEEKDKEGNFWNKNFVSWKFKDEAKPQDRGEVGSIEFDFWAGYKDYSVRWEYDKENNSYLRFNGGQPHNDLNNNSQLQAKVIVIQFMEEKGPIDELKHMLYKTTGQGNALVFQDGQVIKGTWKKENRQARTRFFDSKGKEITFNRGLIWIEILPIGREVNY